VAEDEFHDWYDLEHVPERERVPGFRICRRWIGVEDRKVSLATYDLDAVEVLDSPAYKAIGGENLSPWSKRVTGQVRCGYAARATRSCRRSAPARGRRRPPAERHEHRPELEAEFNEWYDKEHIPALAAVPGVLCARRFRGRAGTASTSRSTI
jgi:hypothetical protein